MALNWNISKVKNYKELINNGRMIAPYEALLLASIIVGINEITEKNYKDFYKRVRFIELLSGSYYYKDGKPLFITEEEIERFIGLKTNTTKKTKSQFLQQFINLI